MAFSRDQAVAAMNKAGNEIIEALEPLPGEGTRDVVNLMVNAGAYFLEHPEGTLQDAIEAADYDGVDSWEEVVDWCRG